MNLQTAEEVWAVLVEECGASPDGTYGERDFAVNWPCSEYRFMGSLGFGGKVRWHPPIPGIPGQEQGYATVDCYSEDRTPERVEMCRRANERLRGAVRDTEWPPSRSGRTASYGTSSTTGGQRKERNDHR